MKFLAIYRPGTPETDRPPTQQEMDDMGKLLGDMTKAGVLLASEGCAPSAKGARVRIDNGKMTVTDGPFPETKELIAGFPSCRSSPGPRPSSGASASWRLSASARARSARSASSPSPEPRALRPPYWKSVARQGGVAGRAAWGSASWGGWVSTCLNWRLRTR